MIVLRTARAILTGWAALLLLGFLVERPLLWLLQRTIGGGLTQPLSTLLDWLCFLAAGWLVGRFHRPDTNRSVLIFLVTLLPFDWQTLYPLNIPWLLRVIYNCTQDARYAVGLPFAFLTNGMLLYSGWLGGKFSKTREPVLSLK